VGAISYTQKLNYGIKCRVVRIGRNIPMVDTRALLRLCDILDVDIEASIKDKIKINSDKYPVDLSKGSADKYTTLRSKIKGILEL